MLFSPHLNWNLPVFLIELSHFDLEHNLYKYIIKIRLLRLSKFENSQLIPLKMTFQLFFQVVLHFNFLLTYSPQTVKSIIILHETQIRLEVPANKYVKHLFKKIADGGELNFDQPFLQFNVKEKYIRRVLLNLTLNVAYQTLLA